MRARVLLLIGAAVGTASAAQSEKGKWSVISESITSRVKPGWPGLTAGVAVDRVSGEIAGPRNDQS